MLTAVLSVFSFLCCIILGGVEGCTGGLGSGVSVQNPVRAEACNIGLGEPYCDGVV